MVERELLFFNPGQIKDSGQCFRWNKIDEKTFSVIAFGKYLEISGSDGKYTFSCSEEEWEDIWKSYFDIETDYEYLAKQIDEHADMHLKECFANGSGIRILKQDLWETIVSFMISQNNNIPRIRGSIEKLCNACALPAEGGGYRFPRPGEVPEWVFEDKNMGFGYRDEYLANIYEFAKNNPDWLDELTKKDYSSALSALLEIKGIGKKVANCICLFGLHHIEAFPIDTHIKQLMDKYYPNGLDLSHYPGYGGVIQQYLFYAEIK